MCEYNEYNGDCKGIDLWYNFIMQQYLNEIYVVCYIVAYIEFKPTYDVADKMYIHILLRL